MNGIIVFLGENILEATGEEIKSALKADLLVHYETPKRSGGLYGKSLF